MKHEGIRKLYHSISEVAELTDLEAHVLRYWETEFEQLRPKKNRAGNRVYTERDIATVVRKALASAVAERTACASSVTSPLLSMRSTRASTIRASNVSACARIRASSSGNRVNRRRRWALCAHPRQEIHPVLRPTQADRRRNVRPPDVPDIILQPAFGVTKRATALLHGRQPHPIQ